MTYQKKSYRKFIATAATATMVASAVTPAFAAMPFTDVSGRYVDAVEYLVDNNITNGISKTQFGTNLTIKRVDAVVMIAKALKLDTTNAPDAGFTDVPSRAAGYVNAVKAKGIINGKTATELGSAQDITRGELAIILARAYELSGDVKNLKFTDVSDRYDNEVAALVDYKITTGKTATSFGTADAVKRGEMAMFLYRISQIDDTPAIPSVDSVTAETKEGITTVSAAVKDADGQTATISIYANDGTTPVTKTAEVKDGKVSVNFDNLPAGTHKAAVKVGDSSKEASFTIAANTPALQNVTPINANQLAVTFNTEVNEASAETASLYSLNGTPASKAALLENGKTVLLTFNGGIEAADGVLVVNPVTVKADKEVKTAKYTSVFTFKDTAKPVVTNTAYSNGIITLTFSEALSAAPTVVRVDGTPVAAADVTLASDKTKVEIKKTLDAGTSAALYVAGAKDAADAANEMDLYNGSVSAPTADTNKPHVTGVQVTGQNTAKVTLSEAITQDEVNATLQQGAEQTPVKLVKDEADVNGKTYTFTVAGNLFNDASTSETFTLYVQKDAITDTSGLKNDLFQTTVTFIKDLQAPALAESAITEGKKALSFTFDEAVTVSGAASAIDIRNAEGVKFTAKSVTLSEDKKTVTVDITDGDTAMAAGTYTVSFPANHFTDAYGNKTGVIKDAFTVGETTNTDTEKPEAAVATSGTNTFKVTFDEEVTNAALSLSNYRLDGQALPAETDIYFTDSTKKAVMIELPKGAINIGDQTTGATAVLTVSGAADTAGNVMTASNFVVTVKDNTSAAVTDIKTVGTAVVVTFSEAVAVSGAVDANDVFDIKVGSTTAEAGNVTAVSGSTNQLQFSLASSPASTPTVEVKAGQSVLKDANGVTVE